MKPAPMSDAQIQLPECEAIRYNFDGYGWDYRDNGSGSLWRLSYDVHQPEGLYSRKQMKEYATECVAARDAQWAEMLGEPVGFICQGLVYDNNDVDEYCMQEHPPVYAPKQEKL